MKRKAQQQVMSDGTVIFGSRYVDIHGNPVAKPKPQFGYSYDFFVTYRNGKNEEANDTVYSDRLYQWDSKKYGELCRKHFGNEGQNWFDRKPKNIEAFMSDWYGKPVKLIIMLEGCNVGNGFPLWLFYLKVSEPAIELTYQHREGEEPHRIIAIYYIDDLPNEVITSRLIPNATDGPYNRVHSWDFDPNKHWGGDYMFYNSFSGGSDDEGLSNPNYTKKAKAKAWLADGIKFKEPVKHITIIDKPIELKRSHNKPTMNPFEFAEAVSSTCYCKVCDGMVGSNWCDKHMHEGEDGELYYDGTNEPVDE